MWRATFMALGISLCIFGAECLVMDRAVLRERGEASASDPQSAAVFQTPTATKRKEFKPKEWMPWSMLSTGAVVILYSFTIPKRVGH